MSPQWFQKPKTSLTEYIAFISKEMSNPDKRDLRDIRKRLRDGVFDISTMLDEYEAKLNDYYEKHPPFSVCDEEENFSEFGEIVKDAFSAGSYKVLQKWAVDYPLNNPDRLAHPISHYTKGFEGFVANWESAASVDGWPSEARVYWDYLVMALQPKSSMPVSQKLSGTSTK